MLVVEKFPEANTLEVTRRHRGRAGRRSRPAWPASSSTPRCTGRRPSSRPRSATSMVALAGLVLVALVPRARARLVALRADRPGRDPVSLWPRPCVLSFAGADDQRHGPGRLVLALAVLVDDADRRRRLLRAAARAAGGAAESTPDGPEPSAMRRGPVRRRRPRCASADRAVRCAHLGGRGAAAASSWRRRPAPSASRWRSPTCWPCSPRMVGRAARSRRRSPCSCWPGDPVARREPAAVGRAAWHAALDRTRRRAGRGRPDRRAGAVVARGRRARSRHARCSTRPCSPRSRSAILVAVGRAAGTSPPR